MPRFSKIDESNIGDHYYLESSDQCLFLYEYTAGKTYAYSQTNNLISNLKKKPSQAIRPGYHYKRQAIIQCSTDLRDALNPDWLANATLVPVPGSKAVGDPDFDDRIERICRGLGQNVDVRRLIIQNASTQASHEAGDGPRRTIEELVGLYQVDETQAHPRPEVIGIVDDVLTTGTHFRAVQQVLNERFPGVICIGLFIARCVHTSPFEDFED
ncbi:hypothetical protein ABI_00270 [Asticcacaulis biprosthecium C19]|uniref:Phosphoribosyltransferase n=1 Tax=Asticcacaulis biprosthecium C19 TaxID=715226 RepID=F4QFY4_9CAUL|nr:hypothetical protein [Asticcacaulis biprosthecium]EGF93795.1 hypothetical protein ABI_00270 [Asticcacaulis biprosthecium C19]